MKDIQIMSRGLVSTVGANLQMRDLMVVGRMHASIHWAMESSDWNQGLMVND